MTLDERARRAASDLTRSVWAAPDLARFHERRSTRHRRRRWEVVAVAASAVVAVGAGVVAHDSSSETRRTVIADPRGADGRILYGEWDASRQQARWFTIRPDGTGNRALNVTATCAVWWPDGSKILITADYYTQEGHPLRPATIRPDGTGVQLLGATRDRDLNLGCGQVAPDGATIAMEGFNDRRPTVNGIYMVRASDGGRSRRLTHSPVGGSDSYPRFSPDGRELVFLRTVPGTSPEGAGALFILSTGGGTARQITPYGSAFLGYNWSPDGRWIAFQRPYGQLYLVHPDGTGLHRVDLRLPAGAGAQNPGWSPDGTRLVFSIEQAGRANIYTADVDGSHLRQVTSGSGEAQTPDWAP